MALAFAALAAASGSTTDGTTFTGTAGTPVSGDLLICFVDASGFTGTCTLTGAWTWTLLTSFTKNAGADTVFVFWARATAATSTTPSVSLSATATGCIIECIRVTGQEGIQPYLRQLKTNAASTANPSVTMDRAILTGDGVLGAVFNGTNSAVQFTTPTNWTEVIEVAYNTPANGATFNTRASGETATTITWTCANTTAWVAVVMEFYVAGTGPTELDSMGMSGMFGQAA
jgi:hypothetical protein